MTTIKQLNAKIDALGKRLATAENDIQGLGLECLEHLNAHGDTMPLNRLFGVLRRTQHQAFMEWALAFGKVNKNANKLTVGEQAFAFAKDKTTDMEGAKAKPWFMFADDKAEATKKAFDFQVAVMQLIKKAAAAGIDHSKLVQVAALADIKADKVPATVITGEAALAAAGEALV